MKGNNLSELAVRYKDADYFEEKDENLDPETLIYDYALKESTPEEGHLTWGHLTVYPGKVKDEYFCTHGHYYDNPKIETYYLCMDGIGLIMYMNREGDCWCEELEEGSLHHVPEGVARRFINLGEKPLMLSLCRSAKADIDFDSVSENPFPCHVYDDNGEMAIHVDIPDSTENGEDIDEATADIEALLKL